MLWNGAPVDLATLRQYLDLTTTMRPMPELHLQPDRRRATSWSTRCSPSPSARR